MMSISISIFGFVMFGVFAYLVGTLSGHSITKLRYTKIIDEMTNKNKELIDRVKKSEAIILHDILQLSPDDMDALREKMKEPKLEELR